MSKTLKVLGDYVILKVKDVVGSDVMMGFYQHAVVANVDDESAAHNIGLGFAEEIAAPAEDTPAEVPEAVFDKPHGNAGQAAWATYALESGQASEDEVKDLTRDELRELYG